jgi:hypothetical protein
MATSSKLWYDKPAALWNQALPLGNGRLGCMIHGRTTTELLSLNEDSIWYGGPQDRVPKNALENLPRLRELVREGQHGEAEKLAGGAFCAEPKGQRHYEPLGSVKIEFGHHGDGAMEYRFIPLSTAAMALGSRRKCWQALLIMSSPYAFEAAARRLSLWSD